MRRSGKFDTYVGRSNAVVETSLRRRRVISNFKEWFESSTFFVVVIRPAAALVLVFGAVATLDWAGVMGDGGPLLQLLAGVLAISISLPVIIRGLKGD